MPPVSDNPQRNRTLELDEIERITRQVSFLQGTDEVKKGTASYMGFIDKYMEKKKMDLAGIYRGLPKTSADMQSKFLQSQEHGPMAQFLEILPLLANREGILGEHIHARVTKTAKPDDEGNSFVDVVVELKNNHLAELAKADKKYRDVRQGITLLVDVTSNPEKADGKVEMLRKHLLNDAKKANVLCYENEHGVLGVSGPKTVVFKSEDYLAQVAKRFRGSFSSLPNGGITLDDEKSLGREYRSFFRSFLDDVQISAEGSKEYLTAKKEKENRPFTKDETALIDSYKNTILFIEAYKNTPGTA